MSELDTLFYRTPESLVEKPLTEEERRKVIAKFREDRAKALAGVKATKAKKATPISLDDIKL